MINESPDIKIKVSENNRKYILEILYGIEEEGIPYGINLTEENEINMDNITRHAFEEAKQSKLSVGVAANRKKAVFHFSGLKENTPLFVINSLEDTEKEELRLYGSNIARIAKGIPLKKYKDS